MNLYDLILIAIIAAVFFLALRKTITNYKKGGCSCGCGGSGKRAEASGCIGCAGCSGCAGHTCGAGTSGAAKCASSRTQTETCDLKK